MAARHAPPRRTLRWVFGALLLVVAAGAGACFFRGDGEEPPEAAKPQEPPTPEFAFSVAKVRAVSVDDEAAGSSMDRASEEVAAVLDGLYTVAFVDPEQWASGRFPELAGHFSGAAAKQAVRDLEDLSLGEAATQIERVEPTMGRLRLSFLIDGQQQPFAAVAETNFRAKGTTVDGRPLRIAHAGTYFLRSVGGTWTIVGYEVEGGVETTGGEAMP